MHKDKISEFTKLATFDSPDELLMDEVLAKMEATLRLYTDEGFGSYLPFLETYFFVTKRVNYYVSENTHYFHDVKAMHRLDAHFAKLYYHGIKPFVLKNKSSTPWIEYLRFCSTDKNTHFLQLLLGINAHINGDLYNALMNAKYTNKEDYFRINKVLIDLIPDVMTYLAFHERDIFGLGGLILRDFYINETRHIIVRWRTDVWKIYEKSLKAKKDFTPQIHSETERIALAIIDIWHRLFSNPLNAVSLIQELNGLKMVVK